MFTHTLHVIEFKTQHYIACARFNIQWTIETAKVDTECLVIQFQYPATHYRLEVRRIPAVNSTMPICCL